MRYLALLTLLFTSFVLLPMEASSTNLSANIVCQINSADRTLDWVDKAIAKSGTDEHALAEAQGEYDKISQHYGGSFDPNHPQLTALKNCYKKISSTVLRNDTNNNSACRFITYNFISSHFENTNRTPLRFKSCCNGCLEGDTQCP